MPSDQWIVIPNWHEFQHYKNRDPTWIKAYTRLLKDDAYVALSFRLRGILHSIWLLYAASDGLVSGSSPARLGRMLGSEAVRMRDIEALNHAGFILLSASKPLALRYQDASPEKRREELPPYPPSKGGDSQLEEQPTKTRKSKRTEPSHEELNPYVCGINGCTIRWHSEARIQEHRENVHGINGNGSNNGATPAIDPDLAYLEQLYDPEQDPAGGDAE